MEETKIVKELVSIKRLLMLQLLAIGYSKSAIAKALGITTAAAVRELIPDVNLPLQDERNKHGK